MVGSRRADDVAWFENHVDVGLVLTATYLAGQRLQRTTLTGA
jgi:hypothetical protein